MISFLGRPAQVSGRAVASAFGIRAKTKTWQPLRTANFASDTNREMGALYKTSVTLQAQTVNDSC